MHTTEGANVAIPDPVSTALAKAGVDVAGAVLKSAEPLLVRMLGGAADELGLLLTDSARRFRERRMRQTLEAAQVKLDAAGLDPVVVRLGTLIPMLQGASLEDDETLSEMWAGLIATAASNVSESAQHPAYARILSEMTPREAWMLNDVAQRGRQHPWAPLRQMYAEKFGCAPEIIRAAHGNLFRLGLWSNTRSDDSLGSVVVIDHFGLAFLAATRGPAPR